MEGHKGRVNFQSNTASATSWSSGPTQKVQSKLIADMQPEQLENVGTTTTGMASNGVVSWGVGVDNMMKNDTTQKVDVLFDEDLVGQVNATVSTDNDVEVLDFPGETYKQITPVSQPVPKNKGLAMVDTENNDNNDIEANAMNSMILDEKQLDKMKYTGDDWYNNQPLSSGKLGVNAISSSSTAKDVNKKGKFFSSESKKNKKVTEKQIMMPMMQKDLGLNDVLPEIDEKELLKNFVRQDFSKLNMSIFSFAAFIFKGVFFIYRKLYIIGLALLAIDLYILLMLPIKTSVIIYGILSFVVGFLANPIYLFLSKSKVKSIHHAKRNRKKKQIELNMICSKAGGSNFAFAFLALVLYLSVLIYGSMYEFPDSTLHKSYDIIVKYYEEKQLPIYDGYIDRLSFDVESIFEIKIPEEFSKETGKIYKYTYSPNGKEEIKSCSLSISVINKFYDVNDFLNQYKTYEKIDMDIKEYKKNSISWFNLNQEKKSFNKMLYATQYNNSVILMEYNMGFDVLENVCENYFEEIFSSIKEKKE